MDKIKVKITEVKESFRLNKKGEKKEVKSVKLENLTGNLIVNLKGSLADNFSSEDRGKKAEITIIFENKEVDKING